VTHVNLGQLSRLLELSNRKTNNFTGIIYEDDGTDELLAVDGVNKSKCSVVREASSYPSCSIWRGSPVISDNYNLGTIGVECSFYSGSAVHFAWFESEVDQGHVHIHIISPTVNSNFPGLSMRAKNECF